MEATAHWSDQIPDHIRKEMGRAAYKLALDFWRDGDPALQRKAMQLLAEYKQRKAAQEHRE